MTVLDTSIPYYPVLMELESKEDPLPCPMAEGYCFIPFDISYQEDWVKLHVALGQLKDFDSGMRYFEETFLSHPQELKKQMLLVVDDAGELAGTSSIWEGFHFGRRRLRVHWVGVDERHQHKGIAKALMVETIRLYNSMQQTEPLYLTTQTNSYVAIQMYLKLGFQPYTKEMPINFHADKDTFQRDNEIAWKLIMEKLHAK